MANVWTTSGAGDIAHEVDPISRIEGHLGVKVTVDGSGVITDANAHGNLWRGFENFLLGRDVNDAITFTQRICGVCPVPHGMTSTYACDTVLGYSKGHITFAQTTLPTDTFGVPKKAVLIRNLVLGAEFLMSSITHFFHLAAPSYVQGPNIPPWTPYFDNSFYANDLESGGAALPDLAAPTLWDAVIYSYVKALKIRRLTFEAGALFAGRMPMTSCYVAGGVTNDGTEDLSSKITAFRTIMEQVAEFVLTEYVPIALALGALYPDFDSQTNVLGDDAQGNPRGYGAGLGRFLAWGGFPGIDASGTLLLPGGVKDCNTPVADDPTHFQVLNKADVYNKFLTGSKSVPTNLTEDITNSRYQISGLDTAVYTSGAAYPGDVARTSPLRSNGYTYMKAPRWAGLPCEVGPLARMVVAGYYPVDGTTPLVANFAGGAGGALYIASGSLDAGMIESTIVAGLSSASNPSGNLLATVVGFIEGMTGGLSTLDRVRARALESIVILIGILGNPVKSAPGIANVSWDDNGWLGQLALQANTAGSTRRTLTVPTALKQGWGGTEAPRGALMHQATIKGGKITKYQCIVPTTWNGSPKDFSGQHGAIEKAMLGATFDDVAKTNNAVADPTGFGAGETAVASYIGGVEVLRIAQSFDPCIACAVH